MTKHITRAEWVAALRSGEYKQAHGVLKSGDAFCCLGVACKLADISDEHTENAGISGFHFFGRDTSEIPALHLYADLGVSRFDCGELAQANDGGFSFSEIADKIEALPFRAMDAEGHMAL